MRDRSGYRQDRSPKREHLSSQIDEYSTKIKELLRSDLIMLEEQNAILKSKCKKVTELEDKVELILKQNTQLLGENQRISKLLHQKKHDYEILKQKFDSQSSQKMQYAAELQYERKKMFNQIDMLEGQIKNVQHKKASQLNDLKSQFQIEVQSLKRQSVSTQQVYEQEIRKLREQLDKKDYELNDVLNRLKRNSSEGEYEILRLKEQKQKLRNQLMYVETDKKKELDAIRIKLENNYCDQIESIKKNHMSNIGNFEVDNLKLKQGLERKHLELEEMASKLTRQRNNYEDAIGSTKRQNQMLRNRMIEFERISESEKDSLRSKITNVHENEIEEMRLNHQKYLQTIQNQISKLESSIGKKNSEIQQLIKEKTGIRQIFEGEGNRLKQQIQALQYKIKDLENKLNDTTKNFEEKLKEKSKHIDYLDKLNQDQLENHENEIRSLKQIIDHQKSQIDSEKLKSRQRQFQMQEQIDDLKNDNLILKDAAINAKNEKDRAIEDLQYELEGIIASLKTKVESLTSKNGILERQVVSLKESIVYKEKEIKNLTERLRVTEEREKKLERENQDLRNKLIKKDQKTNQMLSEQKQRLENTFAFTLDNLKIDHESALKLEANKQADLIDKLKRKENQLDDLLKLYKKMRGEMEVLTQQEANKKDMTLKFPGATADLIATKNLFDVYLKTRVLDVCGDVKDKENYQK